MQTISSPLSSAVEDVSATNKPPTSLLFSPSYRDLTVSNREALAKMYSDITKTDYVGITAFACSLTLNAGFINTLGICIIGSGGADSGAVAHMTGHMSRGLAFAIGTANGDMFWRSLLLIIAFTIGCTLASIFFPNQLLVLERRYAWLYIHTAVILIVALVIDAIFDDDFTFLFFCCMAMGYQNSFGTCCCHSFAHRPSDFSLRTTHLTGLVTDIGIIFGRMLFHKDFSKLPVLGMYSAMIACYVSGGTLAYAGHVSLGKKAVAFNIILICFSSVVYMFVVRKVEKENVLGLKKLVHDMRTKSVARESESARRSLAKGMEGATELTERRNGGSEEAGEKGGETKRTNLV